MHFPRLLEEADIPCVLVFPLARAFSLLLTDRSRLEVHRLSDMVRRKFITEERELVRCVFHRIPYKRATDG